jgi:hypothetical protein
MIIARRREDRWVIRMPRHTIHAPDMRVQPLNQQPIAAPDIYPRI